MWSLLITIALADPDEAPAVPAPTPAYQFITLPEDRSGLPRWEVASPTGDRLDALELARLAGEEGLASRVERHGLASRAGTAGLGVLSGSLLFFGALSMQQAADLGYPQREDLRATGLALGMSGLLAGASATLVWRGALWRRAHPHAWWSADEGELMVSAANTRGSAP